MLMPFLRAAVPSARCLHPAFDYLLQSAPAHRQALHAASVAGLAELPCAETLSRSGYALFIRLTGPLPSDPQARGNALEAAFYPLLRDATELCERLPPCSQRLSLNEARDVVEAWVRVHRTTGARLAAMDLFDGLQTGACRLSPGRAAPEGRL